MGAVQGTSTFPALPRCWPGSIDTSRGAAFPFWGPVSHAFSSGTIPSCVFAGCSFAGVNNISSLTLSFASLVSSTALLLIVAHTHLHSVWHWAEAQCPAQGATVMHKGRQGEEKLWTRAPVKDDVSMRQFLGFTTCCFPLHPSHPMFITYPHAPK